MGAVHRLVLTDRGDCHVHRWLPSCSCGGWVGVNRRRKREAVAQHRQHLRGATRHRDPGPRPTTPTADLPELLR